MLDQTARTQAWLTDFAAMVAELDVRGYCAPQPARKRARRLKPLWRSDRARTGGPGRPPEERLRPLLLASLTLFCYVSTWKDRP